MRIYTTRDSVAAGDDVDAPHPVTVTVPNGLSVEELLHEATVATKLPTIAGGCATWCVSSRVPLQVIAEQWSAPRAVRFLTPKLTELDASDAEVRFHFSYFAQMEPQVVLEVLRRLQLVSKRA